MRDLYSQFTNYLRTIVDDDPRDWEFKRHSDVTYMFEHVMPATGLQYLELISDTDMFRDNEALVKRLCLTNDIYGKPRRCEFNGFLTTSPSNLRYIYLSHLALEHLIKLGKHEVDIVEIGGGYGGLCFFMHRLAPLYNITITSYTLFDLPEPLALQHKYLGLHRINANYHTLDSFVLSLDSFLISTYSFSEINEEVRAEYIDKVLPFINHGFIAWNFIPFYKFIDVDFVVEDEEPLTGGENNKFVYF
jgi:hypothetical protein